eukprot:TRINITY_DN1134_c0_g1_i1.p1 TRINITY_DN1134_c0_g1~~TRINITY_DN1134_c0_g1_i1.p1  ORF type:complete len:179 (+),score=23.63 TRINITY_DN1134_c0_g1_i1:78-539(+)
MDLLQPTPDPTVDVKRLKVIFEKIEGKKGDKGTIKEVADALATAIRYKQPEKDGGSPARAAKNFILCSYVIFHKIDAELTLKYAEDNKIVTGQGKRDRKIDAKNRKVFDVLKKEVEIGENAYKTLIGLLINNKRFLSTITYVFGILKAWGLIG